MITVLPRKRRSSIWYGTKVWSVSTVRWYDILLLLLYHKRYCYSLPLFATTPTTVMTHMNVVQRTRSTIAFVTKQQQQKICIYPLNQQRHGRRHRLSCFRYHNDIGQNYKAHKVHLRHQQEKPLISRLISMKSHSITTNANNPDNDSDKYKTTSLTTTIIAQANNDNCNSNNNDHQHQSSDDDSDTIDNDSIVKERTLLWIRRIVIGLNLCPFAKQSVQSQQLRINVIRGNDISQIIQIVQNEMNMLLQPQQQPQHQHQQSLPQQQQQHTTTIIVCPECYPNDFIQYLNVVHEIEDIIQYNQQYDGIIQLASFHPYYCFDGSNSYTDPDNCTNQSPYPTFHLLREMDVSHVVNHCIPNQDASIIWSRNVDLLNTLYNELTLHEFHTIMKIPSSLSKHEIRPSHDNKNNLIVPPQQQQPQQLIFRVRQILRRFPIKLLKKET
jgi:uncharacterized protein